MPYKEFNIVTFMSGLRGQNRISGRFKTKKAILEAMDVTAHYFNGYASMILGPVARKLVEIHGDNILIATLTNQHVQRYDDEKNEYVIIKFFTYWIQESPGVWKELVYNRPIIEVND